MYVHADLHGASSTIVKNPDPSTPIPPLTLAEAGHACVCRSAAWDAKVVTSAWWVHPEQVSKTAPTGEYLVTGSFMIRGRKNYLPPQPLVMGLAWLFRLEQGSVAAHLGERAPRTLNMAEGATTAADDGVDEKPAGGASGSAEVESEEGEAAPASALDVFMDSSVDTLVGRPAVGGAGTAAATGAAAAAFSRYGLADHLPGSNNTSFSEEVQADGEGGAPGSNAAHQSKRHLSAKERALMKKGGAAAGAPGAAHTKQHHQQQGKKAEGKMPPPPAAGGKQGAGEAEGAAQVTAKGKKAKGRKYEDQDEEDRQLAMALLQSAGQKKDRKQRREERKAKLAARKAANSGVVNQEVTEEDIARLTARLELEEEESNGGGSGQSDDGDGEGVEAAALEQPPSGKADDGRLVGAAAEQSVSGSDGDDGEEDAAAAAQREREEVAELLAEENMAVLDDADKDRLTQLDELTAIPRPEDVLLYAVPVCAPYQVVAGYKYRVKLVPGTLKKGKAYRQGVELLAGRGAAPNPGAQRERELLRAVPEMDGINAMVGGVKLQVAGLQKMQQAKKKAGKKGK